MILDAVMIALAMFTLNIFHPARLLGYGAEWRADKSIQLHKLETEPRDSTMMALRSSAPEEAVNWQ